MGQGAEIESGDSSKADTKAEHPVGTEGEEDTVEYWKSVAYAAQRRADDAEIFAEGVHDQVCSAVAWCAVGMLERHTPPLHSFDWPT